MAGNLDGLGDDRKGLAGAPANLPRHGISEAPEPWQLEWICEGRVTALRRDSSFRSAPLLGLLHQHRSDERGEAKELG
jgi:hypothetical protein